MALAHLLSVPVVAGLAHVLGVEVEGSELVLAADEISRVLPRALRVALVILPTIPLDLVLGGAILRLADGVDGLHLVLLGVGSIDILFGVGTLQRKSAVREQPRNELWLEPVLGQSERLASISRLCDLERPDGACGHERR